MKLAPKQREFKKLLGSVSDSEKERFLSLVQLLKRETEIKIQWALDYQKKTNTSTNATRKILGTLK